MKIKLVCIFLGKSFQFSMQICFSFAKQKTKIKKKIYNKKLIKLKEKRQKCTY